MPFMLPDRVWIEFIPLKLLIGCRFCSQGGAMHLRLPMYWPVTTQLLLEFIAWFYHLDLGLFFFKLSFPASKENLLLPLFAKICVWKASQHDGRCLKSSKNSEGCPERSIQILTLQQPWGVIIHDVNFQRCTQPTASWLNGFKILWICILEFKSPIRYAQW